MRTRLFKGEGLAPVLINLCSEHGNILFGMDAI